MLSQLFVEDAEFVIQGRVGHVPSVMSGRDAIIEGLVAKRLVMQPEQRRHIATNLVVLEQTDSLDEQRRISCSSPPWTVRRGRLQQDDMRTISSNARMVTGAFFGDWPYRTPTCRDALELSHVGLEAPGILVPELATFYGDRLGLPTATAEAGGLIVEVGESTLELHPADGAAYYHLAFLVPGDRFDAALAWAGARRAPPPPGDGRRRVRLHELGCAGGLLPRSRRQHRRADRAPWHG